MTAPTRPYTRQQCWSLAMRAGMLTEGWTMTDVRRRWRELLAEHGLAATVLIPADEPVRRPPVRALPEPGGKPAAVYSFASCGTTVGAAQHERVGERPCRACAEVQP